MSERCIIVGAGHAAAQMVASLRGEGWDGEILLIGDEASMPYQRPPLSKAYLAGAMTAQQLLIRPEAFYQKHKVELLLNTRVTKIDRERRIVSTNRRQTHSYDKLCLATGTRPRRLGSVPGAELAGIHYLRSLADIDRIRGDMAAARKAVIVGGGYIGLETAASLRKGGLDVTVIEAADRILQRVTSPQLSDFFRRVHRQHGVTILESTGLAEFCGEAGRVVSVRTTRGHLLTADIVVVGVGVEVNGDLAQDCGLDFDNGIVVDDYCRTSDANIVAIGDCTNQYNAHYQRRLRLESVPNATEQAKTAAKLLCGKPQVNDSLPWFWSDQYDIKLQIAGISDGYDEMETRGDVQSGCFAIYYLRQGVVIATDAINSPRDFMLAKKLIQTQSCLPETAAV